MHMQAQMHGVRMFEHDLTRAFNETPVNARKCRPILCKLLYLLQHGETIGKAEATDTFFAITKLWQAKDITLRMLVYLSIKELCQMSSDVIIVTSSLKKDMTGREDVYRAPAIRALCRILNDTGMLQAIERYMKQAIVDKTASVSSAALVSSLHLMRKSPEEAVSADNHMVQFHALSLLVQIRANDRLAILKMVQKFSKSGLRSPLALCQLVRVAARLIAAESEQHALGVDGGGNAESRSSSSRVACATNTRWSSTRPPLFIARLPRISSGELASAVSVLQLLLSLPKPTLRFAAVRMLNRISIDYPQAVISCNVDLEQLTTDSNRSIATWAITTLLKTGAEASVERLMKQIGTFVSEISDELKIVVIEAIRSLCHRYPRKHATLMNFLASMLRDEGGFDYKKANVDTIITIVEDNPGAKELGLSHLNGPQMSGRNCRFWLRAANVGPQMSWLPKKTVRAAAVTSLYFFPVKLASMSEFAACGALFKSCAAVKLTETITEYNVSCVKHIFNDDFVLLQLEPIDVGLADFLLATAPKGASFTTAWDEFKEEGHETEE
ncbi:hypothetical protein niasHS_013021 [Heterodera schachtii]|uniref:Coatomer subunit gamma n=1 Tax=Heterodera schachtii TaxID=97005 RepID=A0ABD2IVY3_HETSC